MKQSGTWKYSNLSDSVKTQMFKQNKIIETI